VRVVVAAARRVLRGHSLRASIGSPGRGSSGSPEQIPGTSRTTKLTMDNIKRGAEAKGGTMDSFLHMQVFFCLRSDDSTAMPTGSAAAAAYQKNYTDLTDIHHTYFTSRPPRSCFALSWIPGSSLIEVVGAAYIDPNVTPAAPGPPAARPRI